MENEEMENEDEDEENEKENENEMEEESVQNLMQDIEDLLGNKDTEKIVESRTTVFEASKVVVADKETPLTEERNVIEIMLKKFEMRMQERNQAGDKPEEASKGTFYNKALSIEDSDPPATNFPECESEFGGSSQKEELTIHMGEVHMEEYLEREVEQVFLDAKRENCDDMLETDYLKKEHILLKHPWKELTEKVDGILSENLEVYNEEDALSNADPRDDTRKENDTKKKKKKIKGKEFWEEVLNN